MPALGTRLASRTAILLVCGLVAFAAGAIVVHAATSAQVAKKKKRANAWPAFMIRAQVDGELVPGRNVPIKLSVANNRLKPIWILRLSVRLAVDAKHVRAGCKVARDYHVDQMPKAVFPIKVASYYRATKKRPGAAALANAAEQSHPRQADPDDEQPAVGQSERLQGRDVDAQLREQVHDEEAQEEGVEGLGSAMRSIRRISLAALLALACTVLLAPAASAYWTNSGFGTIGSLTETLPAGNTPTVSAAGTTVTVNISQVSVSGQLIGALGGGYTVKRYPAVGGTASTPGGTCGTSVTGATPTLSCTETSTPPGDWKYTVSPTLHQWTSAESARSTTVVIRPTRQLASRSPAHQPRQ